MDDRLLADALHIGDGAMPPQASTYRVFVRDLMLACSIGIYAYEKQIRQRVRVNVELLVEPPPSNDAFVDVLNYETIVTGIKAIAQAGHIDLVETFADRVVALCFRDRRVWQVRVVIEKLDVYPEAESVGVMIERRRDLPPRDGR